MGTLNGFDDRKALNSSVMQDRLKLLVQPQDVDVEIMGDEQGADVTVTLHWRLPAGLADLIVVETFGGTETKTVIK